MNIQSLLFYLFAAVSTMYVIHIGLYLIGANIYDIWQCYRRGASTAGGGNTYSRFASGLGQSTVKGGRWAVPLVSVAIPAHNEEKVIVRCLESIRLSTYPRVEILVADDASSDRTKQLVKDYMLRHPNIRLHVYRMRQNVGKGKALSTVLRRYAHGEFAMMVDADSLISPDAITNAISYFSDPTVAGVAANVQIIYDPTVLGVLQKFEHMIGYRSKKMYTVINAEFIVGGVASTYRMGVLRRVNFYDTDTATEDIGLSIKVVSLGNRSHRMVYAADVVAMTEGVTTFRGLLRQRFRWKYGTFQNLLRYRALIGNPGREYSRALTMYRLPMAILSEFILLSAPFTWGYALYMTFQQYNPVLVVGAYLTITLYMLIVVWFDENLHIKMRFRMTVYAFIAYYIFYIMELIQLVAILRCLFKFPDLLLRQNAGSTWTSPERVGKKLLANEI